MPKSQRTYAGLKMELDQLLVDLQDEDVDIDEATKKYERGIELVKLLESKLKLAENKITKLNNRFDKPA